MGNGHDRKSSNDLHAPKREVRGLLGTGAPSQVSMRMSNHSANGTVVIQAAQFAQLQFYAIPTSEANTWKVDSCGSAM